MPGRAKWATRSSSRVDKSSNDPQHSRASKHSRRARSSRAGWSTGFTERGDFTWDTLSSSHEPRREGRRRWHAAAREHYPCWLSKNPSRARARTYHAQARHYGAALGSSTNHTSSHLRSNAHPISWVSFRRSPLASRLFSRFLLRLSLAAERIGFYTSFSSLSALFGPSSSRSRFPPPSRLLGASSSSTSTTVAAGGGITPRPSRTRPARSGATRPHARLQLGSGRRDGGVQRNARHGHRAAGRSSFSSLGQPGLGKHKLARAFEKALFSRSAARAYML